MDENSCVIYIGEKFTIEWYYDIHGHSIAKNYFSETAPEQKRKFYLLIKRICDFGKINDITKFRNEGDGIFAFKPQPDRYLSFFTDGKKIIVTNGFKKKTDKLPKNEKELAIKYRKDYFERKSGEKNEK